MSKRAVRLECLRLLADASEANVRRFLALCQDPTPRVSLAALIVYLDWMLGPPTEGGLLAEMEKEEAEERARSLDLSRLTPEERGHAMECAGQLKRYTALTRTRAVEAVSGETH